MVQTHVRCAYNILYIEKSDIEEFDAVSLILRIVLVCFEQYNKCLFRLVVVCGRRKGVYFLASPRAITKVFYFATKLDCLRNSCGCVGGTLLNEGLEIIFRFRLR